MPRKDRLDRLISTLFLVAGLAFAYQYAKANGQLTSSRTANQEIPPPSRS